MESNDRIANLIQGLIMTSLMYKGLTVIGIFSERPSMTYYVRHDIRLPLRVKMDDIVAGIVKIMVEKHPETKIFRFLGATVEDFEEDNGERVLEFTQNYDFPSA